jgi:type I restriction enzyme R subunit
MDEETHQRVLNLTKELVGEFQEASQIVGFFQKQDEIKTMAKKIKRSMLDQGFDDPDLRKAVTERFMDLGKRHFR